jgi:hypothetical protein
LTSYTITLVASAGLGLSIVVSTPQNNFAVSADVTPIQHRTYFDAVVASGSTKMSSFYEFIQADQPESRVDDKAIVEHSYPRMVEIASGVVVVGTIVSVIIGYFAPGQITGSMFPIAVILWWLLYHLIIKYDEGER